MARQPPQKTRETTIVEQVEFVHRIAIPRRDALQQFALAAFRRALGQLAIQ